MIAERLPPPQPELVPLNEALGRILLDEVICLEPIPPFPNSAMDGYAVRSSDLESAGGRLRIAGEVRAGQWPDTPVSEGSCLRIMTGAPLPRGADAVVPVEWTVDENGGVVINRGIEAGRHVRPAGQDMAVGERVLPAGVRLGAAEVSVLATLGLTPVRVGRQPLVSVLSTGDELVAPNETPAAGQIRNSNGPALAARARMAGAQVDESVTARDRTDEVARAVEAARRADVLVVSGGVSVGRYDIVKDVLDAAGMELVFWKVRQRPGKPLAFGVLGKTLVFGLPGNPVSSSVCFDQYVRPALVRMQGGAEGIWRGRARLTEEIAKPDGLHVFARVRIDTGAEGDLRATPAGAQGSNISMSLVRADGIAHLPAALEAAPAGTLVEVELLDPSRR